MITLLAKYFMQPSLIFFSDATEQSLSFSKIFKKRRGKKKEILHFHGWEVQDSAAVISEWGEKTVV